MQQRAAQLGPSQAYGGADLVLELGAGLAILGHLEELLDRLGVNDRLLGALGLVAAHDLEGDLAADIADLALQVSHPSFAGVLLDDQADAVLAEVDILALLQAHVLDLLGDQVALRDLSLLVLGVAADADHFHAVQQRCRERVQHVRRGDEEDLAEIELHVEVVVLEGRVLFRVQHLHQRRGRVSPEVGGHLVDLVQHHDRISRAGLLHHLDDLPRESADVCAPVPPDLGLVAHAAQRQADELAARGPGDRLAQRGLAHSRRPHEAQDGPLRAADQAAHCEKLEDALLDLLEAVVVRVEHLFGIGEIPDLAALGLPRHR